MPSAKTRFLDLCAQAVRRGKLVKLTLSDYWGADATLRNVFVRPVVLRDGPRLSFVYRHATRDITKNLAQEEGLAQVATLLAAEFQTANLFTTDRSAQLEQRDGRKPRLVMGKPNHAPARELKHDRTKRRLIDPQASPWLCALGVTSADGKVAKGMEAKFRQINKFVELLQHLMTESRFEASDSFTLVDMGCGKGYLTFAAYEFLRMQVKQLKIRGVEARPELVELCNRVAAENKFGGLHFEAGTIEGTSLEHVDVLVALHACDTATDDAIAKGIEAGASLILVAPCCHKELRPQLRPPPVLAAALKHGILRERQAEFVTDALRAALLEWAGYDTKVFEFISTEHTAKNLMIAAVKRERVLNREEEARRVAALAAFYGIRSQRLAGQLGFELDQPRMDTDEHG
ncbi:MAG TPA: SAM-dependent methyltransferase [Verrucomicrobiae bacterium]|nr:SAM-dependent methyltransferase [Verrucomicrobiae bacterium]